MDKMRKPDWRQFDADVTRRQITRLVHFSPIGNLISIFEQQAILSRDELRTLSVDAPELHLDDFLEINDPLRLDQRTDCINLSIQHPNYFLLEHFKQRYRAKIESWCVIAVSPKYVWYEGVVFSVGNAASSDVRRLGVDGTLAKFNQLFSPQIAIGTRNG